MKKFFKKYYGVVIVIVLIIGFVALSLLIEDKGGTKETMSDDVTAWLADTQGEQPVVAVMAMTTCPHCTNFKPVMSEVYEKYGFKVYWFYIDSMDESNYKTLTSTYELKNYENSVPYTFIVKNKEFVAGITTGMEKETLVEFLKTNNVIK